LQVGIIVNKQLIIPQFFSKITWLTLLLTNGAGLLIAWFLANFLTRPIRKLSDFLNQNAQIENGHFSIEKITSPELQPKKNSRDEFDVLITAINQLIERVNQGFQISRLWTYQMSHEIKTPLSIVSSILNQPNSIETLTEKIRLQIFKISETVNAFLSWAEAQSIRPNISHVIRISRLINDVIEKVKIKINTEIILDLEYDFIVGINYNQMEQVFTNLVINAYDHGKKGPPIRILCAQNAVTVFNHGDPFPQRILDNIGQPFNKGDSQDIGLLRGTGLGLAYVATVCQMNNYLLDIQHTDGITSIRLDLTSAIS
ncbi:HAMP domain-containing histidine kinase, partial [bacterium]|nr:HAMP domain-containing histidine kinase [bacterium]